jgi:broad specificity phosphatase PhoE
MIRMMTRFRSFAFALLLLLLSGAAATAQTTIVILVRHAEQETGQDPALSALGRARADSLVRAVQNAGISAIYHTALRRTTETARAVGDAIGVTPTVLTLRAGQAVPDHAAEVAADVLAKYRGRTVLIVGHSNTVPAIISALGVSDAPRIADTEYFHFFTVIIQAEGVARLLRSRYGA